MSLEALLTRLADSLDANTAALTGKSAGAATGKGKTDEGTTTTRRRSSKTDEDAPKSKYTADDVKAAAVKVKEKLGTTTAKEIIAEHGAEELAKLKPAVFDDFVEACQKALDDADGEDNL